MKIYTKTGDAGDTGLFGGPRVRKDDARVEAYGAVDELNAQLGVARALGGAAHADLDGVLASAQDRLFTIGAELATPPGARAHAVVPPIEASWTAELEAAIDRWEEELAPLHAFILPFGPPPAAQLHVARAVCRRAERRVVSLHHLAPVHPEVLPFLNRLSDLLFVAARLAGHRAGAPEHTWDPRRRR
jgi:cob(I)alamin adenosyltransferase